MTIYLGANKMGLGGIAKAYLGNTLVYQKGLTVTPSVGTIGAGGTVEFIVGRAGGNVIITTDGKNVTGGGYTKIDDSTYKFVVRMLTSASLGNYNIKFADSTGQTTWATVVINSISEPYVTPSTTMNTTSFVMNFCANDGTILTSNVKSGSVVTLPSQGQTYYLISTSGSPISNASGSTTGLIEYIAGDMMILRATSAATTKIIITNTAGEQATITVKTSN